MSHFGTMTRDWDLVPAALSILGQVAKPSPPVGIARRGTGLPQTRLADLGMCIGSIIVYAVVGILTVFGLYYAAASPPLHLAYDVAPSAGPSTIYVPGGGFSGFWFHLGFLQSLENRDDYDYYCFSSGCLATVAALMNRTVNDTANAGFYTQSLWLSGNLSRFELVDTFFEKLLPHDDESITSNLDRVLTKLKILVTTRRDGYRVTQPESRDDLKDLLLKTTWVPYVTGWGFLSDKEDVYYDGGFSRLLHPECEHRLDLPLIWETLIHTFSPGLNQDQVQLLWVAGNRYDYSIPKRTSDGPNASEVFASM